MLIGHAACKCHCGPFFPALQKLLLSFVAHLGKVVFDVRSQRRLQALKHLHRAMYCQKDSSVWRTNVGITCMRKMGCQLASSASSLRADGNARLGCVPEPHADSRATPDSLCCLHFRFLCFVFRFFLFILSSRFYSLSLFCCIFSYCLFVHVSSGY